MTVETRTLPYSMMTYLRGRRNLDLNDNSHDADIMDMSPAEIVTECAHWRLGDGEWATTFAFWMKSAGAKPEDFLG